MICKFFFCVTVLVGGPLVAANHRCLSVTTVSEEDDCFHVLDIFKAFVYIFRS